MAWRGGGGGVPEWEPRSQLGMNLGPLLSHLGSISLIVNLKTAIVSPQFHINHDDFFETVLPTAGNPHTCSNWQDLSGLINYKQPVRGPSNTSPQRSERPKAVITRELQKPPTHDKEEEGFPMQDIPPEEEDMPPSEGDGNHTPL